MCFVMISLCIQEIFLTARLRHKIIILKGLCVYVHGFWPHLWMSLKNYKPETFRGIGEVSGRAAQTVPSLDWFCCFIYWPDIQMSMCVCFLCNALLTWVVLPFQIFFSPPLAALVSIFTHGVAAGQMHRTVNNQQGEPSFPNAKPIIWKSERAPKKKDEQKWKQEYNVKFKKKGCWEYMYEQQHRTTMRGLPQR